jgi:hypothetical protein
MGVAVFVLSSRAGFLSFKLAFGLLSADEYAVRLKSRPF